MNKKYSYARFPTEALKKDLLTFLDTLKIQKKIDLLPVATGKTVSVECVKVLLVSFRLSTSLAYYTFFHWYSCFVLDFSKFQVKLEKFKKNFS